MSNQLVAARAALHFWEEPCISGEAGSGTVFFSGCSLACVYCQNHDIAIGKTGKTLSEDRLAEIFLELQEQGALNINLVTPTHYVPQIAQSLIKAKANGLVLPIVYNTGSFETVDTIHMLDGLIDIYLPDLKYYSNQLSLRYSNAPYYFEHATKALQEMFHQVGPVVFEDDIMKRGMIVRHLALPNSIDDSKHILKYLYDTYHDDIYVSIMNQYTPLPQVTAFPEINRPLTEEEYDNLIDYAIDLGYENAFIQEGETAKESFIPPFTCEGI
jgi:putative pyruvate formate lyase activating enzyme